MPTVSVCMIAGANLLELDEVWREDSMAAYFVDIFRGM